MTRAYVYSGIAADGGGLQTATSCIPSAYWKAARMRLAIFLSMLIVSTVCQAEIGGPFVFGEATQFESTDRSSRRTLGTPELGALSSWLDSRKMNWEAHITEPSNEPRVASLHLVRGDGETIDLDVVTRYQGGNYLRVVKGPGTRWAYESLIVKTKYAQQYIDQSGLAELIEICFTATNH